MSNSLRPRLSLLALAFLLAAPLKATTAYYASSAGSGSTCSKASPCDVRTLMNHSISPLAGKCDAVGYLRGGSGGGYAFTESPVGSIFRATIHGTAACRITIRNYPGEWPVLSAAAETLGSSGEFTSIFVLDGVTDVTFQGIVFRDTSTRTRTSAFTGTFPGDIWRRAFPATDALSANCARVWFVYCVGYDLGSGPGGANDNWQDTLYYGNWVILTGWLGAGTDRGHGHNFYPHNGALGGTLTYYGNVSAYAFGNGVQFFGSGNCPGSTGPFVKNIYIAHNAHYGNGQITNMLNANATWKGPEANFIVGQGLVAGCNHSAEGIVMTTNYADFTDIGGNGNGDQISADGHIGYQLGLYNPVISNNFFFAGTRHGNVSCVNGPPADPTTCTNPSFTPDDGSNGNTLTAPTLTSNTGYGVPVCVNACSGSLLPTGSGNTWTDTIPSSMTPFVEPTGKFEAGRGYVLIYNWNATATPISVNISSLGLQDQQTFDVYGCGDYADGRVTNGTYSASTGTFSFPFTAAAQPIQTPAGFGVLTKPGSSAVDTKPFACYWIVPTSNLYIPQ